MPTGTWVNYCVVFVVSLINTSSLLSQVKKGPHIKHGLHFAGWLNDSRKCIILQISFYIKYILIWHGSLYITFLKKTCLFSQHCGLSFMLQQLFFSHLKTDIFKDAHLSGYIWKKKYIGLWKHKSLKKIVAMALLCLFLVLIMFLKMNFTLKNLHIIFLQRCIIFTKSWSPSAKDDGSFTPCHNYLECDVDASVSGGPFASKMIVVEE